MAFCPSCGRPIAGGAQFCGGCGAVAPEEPPTEAAADASADDTPADDESAADTPVDAADDEPAADAPVDDAPAADETVALPGCVSCGSPLVEGAVFCGACGTSQSAAAAGAAAATTAVTQALAPPTQAATTQAFPVPIQPPPQAPFVPGFEATSGYGQPPVTAPPGYGQAAPPGYGQTPPPPPSADYGTGYGPPAAYGEGGGPAAPRRRVNPLAISLAIILVTAVVAVLAVYLATRDSGDPGGSAAGGTTPTGSASGGASPTASAGGSGVAAQVQSVLAPVSESQAAANDAVKNLKATQSSLEDVAAAGEDLSAAAQTAESAASQITSTVSEEEATLQALTKALQAQQAYGQALAGLPGDPDELTKATATAIEKAGQLATDAYEGFANAAGPASAAMAEGVTPPEAYNKVTTLAGKIAKDKLLKAYLVKVEGLMGQSGEGRDDVVKAITGVRGMSMNPTTAGGLIDAVYENRRAVLKKVKGLRPPADARAKQVRNEFVDALTYSLKADTAFAYWILYIHDYYYQPPQGYQGNVPLNADYRGAVTWSGKASAAKERLVKAYNKLAKQYGMKHDWAAQDI